MSFNLSGLTTYVDQTSQTDLITKALLNSVASISKGSIQLTNNKMQLIKNEYFIIFISINIFILELKVICNGWYRNRKYRTLIRL